jgi:hypothetical protein
MTLTTADFLRGSRRCGRGRAGTGRRVAVID